MKDLIVPLLITIAMGGYAGLTCWIMALQRKIRDLERDQRARQELRLADKPYMLPKQNPLSEVWDKWPGDEPIGDILEALNQQDHEIRIISRPVEPEIESCRREPPCIGMKH